MIFTSKWFTVNIILLLAVRSFIEHFMEKTRCASTQLKLLMVQVLKCDFILEKNNKKIKQQSRNTFIRQTHTFTLKYIMIIQ